MPRRISTVLLALLAACGKPPPEDIVDIQGPYPLRQILNESAVVVEGTLSEVDPGKLAAILDVKRTLRGTCPHLRFQLRLEVGFRPYYDLIRRQLVNGAPAILFLGEGDGGGGGALYYNRVFYVGNFRSDLPGPPSWAAMYLERGLNRAYNGGVESLAEVLRKGLAGEAALPPWRPDLAPIDTPSLKALPLPGNPVDEDYIPEPFRQKPPAPPTLRAAENPHQVVEGLHLDYAEGVTYEKVDFDSLKPDKTDIVSRLDLAGLEAANRYALRWRGYIDIPKDGEYTFFVRADGTAEFRIGDSSLAASKRETAVDVALKAGRHALRLTYLGFGGEQALQVLWAGPGFAKQPLPEKALCR